MVMHVVYFIYNMPYVTHDSPVVASCSSIMRYTDFILYSCQ